MQYLIIIFCVFGVSYNTDHISCSQNLGSISIDQRVQFSTYLVKPPYSPNKQQFKISLFCDKLLKTDLKPSINPHSINKILNSPDILILLKYYAQNQSSFIHVGSGTALQDILLAMYIKNKQWNTKLYLIEPQPFTYSLCVKNIYLNDLDGLIKVYHTAISSKSNQLINQFNVKLSDMSSSELIEGTSTRIRADYKVQVPVTSLDQLFEGIQQKGKSISFVYLQNKLMIVQTLQGMKNILQKFEDIGILVDWVYGSAARRSINRFIQIYQQMQRNGFRIYHIIFDQTKTNITKFQQISSFKKIFMINQGKLLFLSTKKILPPLQIFDY